MFTGIAQRAARQDVATGVSTQADGSWRVNRDNTRCAQDFWRRVEQASANTTSSVLPVDAGGIPDNGCCRLSIVENQRKFQAGLYGVYVQDEWKLTPALTLNYGLRFDMVEQFTHRESRSFRGSIWCGSHSWCHAAYPRYARYFVPPPFEALAPTDIAKFAGTTAAPEVTWDGHRKVRAERSRLLLDAASVRCSFPGLTVGVDAYYKISRNLIDEGQFGAPIILTAFNYARGVQQGVELTASYDVGPLSLYANLARSRAMGEDINSAQYNFALSELSYIQSAYIFLDHDQTWSSSVGGAYTFNKDSPYAPTRVLG